MILRVSSKKFKKGVGMFLRSKILRIGFVLWLLVLSTGCSVMRSYNDELTETIGFAQSNQVDVALQTLESNNKYGDKDLLYYMEKGQLLRFDNRYRESSAAWFTGDKMIDEWEAGAIVRLGAGVEYVGTVLLNDKTRRYDGHDYEKVMLTTQLALNHLLNGDWDSARIEIKQMHEREALIARVLAEDKEELEAESQKKGVKTTFKDLNGYPVESLDAPEVTALKNGNQSAFSHYLAGYVFESLNEPGLAAPGYRQAIELNPNIAILEEGLAGLETRPRSQFNQTDVLFVVESGTAPSLNSITIPIPVIVGNTGVVPISFPILDTDPTHTATPVKLDINGQNPIPLTAVTSLDLMSRRALRDDMPGIILRGILRAAAKTAAQKALYDQGGAVAIAGVAVNIVNVITETADERTWRTLPSTISIGRASLPSGDYEVGIRTSSGVTNTQVVKLQGGHAVVVVRLIGNQVFWSQSI